MAALKTYPNCLVPRSFLLKVVLCDIKNNTKNQTPVEGELPALYFCLLSPVQVSQVPCSQLKCFLCLLCLQTREYSLGLEPLLPHTSVALFLEQVS